MYQILTQLQQGQHLATFGKSHKISAGFNRIWCSRLTRLIFILFKAKSNEIYLG